MVKPVDHGLVSGTATTAWEGAKNSVGGGFWGAIVGAVVGAGTFLLASVVTVAPAITAVGVGLGIAALSSLSVGMGILVAFGAIAAAGAVVGSIPGATFGTLGGGITGIFKGVGRVSNEKAAYVEKGDNHKLAMTARMQYAAQAGAQQGFMAGRQQGQQEGAAMVAERLREMQMAQLAERMGPAPQKSHTAAIEAERAAAATAGKQVS